MQYFCGIDTGGTFTDCVVMDESGRITIAKSPSTPKDFAAGFFNALEVAAEKLGLTLSQLMQNTRLLLHGTTVGTNAIVQLKGVKTGLITTRGHGDALIIMRSVARPACRSKSSCMYRAIRNPSRSFPARSFKKSANVWIGKEWSSCRSILTRRMRRFTT